jgi:hypothetical protein
MEEKAREIPKIKVIYADKEELDKLAIDNNFVNFIQDEALSSIKQAIENNEKEICLVEINNLECKIMVKRKDFKKVLEKIIEKYALIENYEGCKKLNDLISKI